MSTEKSTTKVVTVKRKEIELSNGTTVYLRKPGVAQQQKADWEYSRVFNEAIREQIPPRATLIKQLRKDGIWTDDDMTAEVELRKSLAEAIARLAIAANGPNEEEFEEAREAVRIARESLYIHTSRLTSYLQHCAETRADDAKNYHLAMLCTENEDGSRVWKTREEFEQDDREELVQRATMQVLYLVNGLDPDDYASNYPENRIKWAPVKVEVIPDEVAEVLDAEANGK